MGFNSAFKGLIACTKWHYIHNESECSITGYNWYRCHDKGN